VVKRIPDDQRCEFLKKTPSTEPQGRLANAPRIKGCRSNRSRTSTMESTDCSSKRIPVMSGWSISAPTPRLISYAYKDISESGLVETIW
jgi:hypothetical protein